MRAWIIKQRVDLSTENSPLQLIDLPQPVPKSGELLIRIKTCAVCHTEIDEIEGRTPPSEYPVIPGHQVIGIVEKTKGIRKDLKTGVRVGVAWIYSSCGECNFCKSGHENLCRNFKATGRDAHGGYAEYMTINENFVYVIPENFTDTEAAPLLCAGAIGYRSVALCNLNNGDPIGLTGFGASAHLVLKLLRHLYPASEVYVFGRNEKERKFAMALGAIWAGDTSDQPDVLLRAIIDTTPAWKPILYALKYLRPGGRLVINAIRKESIDQGILSEIDYSKHLWMEKEIKSVANVTRDDVQSFINIAGEIPIKPTVEEYSFDEANRAILDIKNRKIKGAKVLVVNKT